MCIMLGIAALAFAWSAITPADYATWFFELFIGLGGILVLLALARRFLFSPIVYYVAAVHFVILAVGAKYTYENEPLFNWLRDHFELTRNYSDRVGHFAQGLTPALVAREVFARVGGMKGKFLLALASVSVALAFSALYEILEWRWVVAFYPDRGPEWLGMQGDMWDAQGDMLMALCGALAAQALSPWQNRQIERLESDA